MALWHFANHDPEMRKRYKKDTVAPDSPGLTRPPGSLYIEFLTCNNKRWGCLNSSTCNQKGILPLDKVKNKYYLD